MRLRTGASLTLSKESRLSAAAEMTTNPRTSRMRMIWDFIIDQMIECVICWCHVYHDMQRGGVAWCSRMEQVGAASVHKFQEAPALSALAGQNWLPRGTSSHRGERGSGVACRGERK